jgi:hypothetical protein
VTHLRSHIDWFTADAPDAWQEIARLDTVGITLERVALVPLTLFRDPADAEAIARTVANSGERCLLGGFIHSSNWDAAAMANLLDSAARWDLDLDLHIDEELSEVSQGLTWLADHLSRHPFPGHICCSHGCALAAGSDEQAAPILRQLAAHGVTLIALPMTNLLLQDATFGRTPRQRGSPCCTRRRPPAWPPCSAATTCRTLSARRELRPAGHPGLRPVQRSAQRPVRPAVAADLRSRGANRFAGRRGALCRRGGGQRGDFPG